MRPCPCPPSWRGRAERYGRPRQGRRVRRPPPGTSQGRARGGRKVGVLPSERTHREVRGIGVLAVRDENGAICGYGQRSGRRGAEELPGPDVYDERRHDDDATGSEQPSEGCGLSEWRPITSTELV